MDVAVGQLLRPDYAFAGVVFSYLASFSGSLLALLCARRIVRADGTLNLAMLVWAAVALGGIGIWSMHFIGMSAYRLPIPIVYEASLTAVSFVAAVVISGIALYLAGGTQFSMGGWVAGSLLAGLGASVMHYMGMFAMTMRAVMYFDVLLVAASVTIAIVAATSALWLAFNLTRFEHQVAAAAVMAVAICAMHYLGMAAADVVCTASSAEDTLTIGDGVVWLAVFGFASAVLVTLRWMLTGRLMGSSVGTV